MWKSRVFGLVGISILRYPQWRLSGPSTKARIEPETLLPLDFAGLPIESKMVDFGIYIDPDDEMHDALRQLASRDPFTTASWNHTCYPPLQKRPLAISIETKLTGRDWDTAKIQMSIWVTAQLNKLEQLVASDGGGLPGLPYIPVIVIQGHEWYFLAANRERGGTVCLPPETTRNSDSQYVGSLGKDTPRFDADSTRSLPDCDCPASTWTLVRNLLSAMVQNSRSGYILMCKMHWSNLCQADRGKILFSPRTYIEWPSTKFRSNASSSS